MKKKTLFSKILTVSVHEPNGFNCSTQFSLQALFEWGNSTYCSQEEVGVPICYFSDLQYLCTKLRTFKSTFGLIKFIYSEKATKFCEIFPLLLTVCNAVKSKVKISQNFEAFSEYMNCNWPFVHRKAGINWFQ